MTGKPQSLAEARAYIDAVKREAGREVPEPPDEPLPDNCCGRGCERCVFLVYYEALEVWGRDALGKA